MSFMNRIKGAIVAFRAASPPGLVEARECSPKPEEAPENLLSANPQSPPQEPARKKPEPIQSPDERNARMEALTPREKQVLEHLLEGKKMREIAEMLGIKFTTVSFHMTSLYKKLEVHDRTQLILRYSAAREPASLKNQEE